ncbi:MAG: C40 family peptidase [Rhizobiales bacterium]|nr:C40 family peptidase [Hyphomicrobiales bacterium]
MSANPDLRVTPWRPDLAAAHLSNTMEARKFTGGTRRGVHSAVAPLHAGPCEDSPRVSEALLGEAVMVFEERDGWAWGQLQSDDYVGYLPAVALGPEPDAATHRVASLRTFRYAAPDIKSQVTGWASLNSRLQVVEDDGILARLGNGEYVVSGHLAPLDEPAPDFVAVAERFVGTPYLWGGKSSLGLDCSALLQQSLTAAGIACPRDSDMIEAQIGDELGREGPDVPPQRGDLIFWSGHCAILTSATELLHANAHHMATVIEDAEQAFARIARVSGPVTSIRRISGLG